MMRKRWFIYLSILVLVFNFIPNFIQVKALADLSTNEKNNIELVNQSNLKVSYNIVESSDTYSWDIHYTIDTTKADEEMRLKLKFDSNQVLNMDYGDTWEVQEDNTLISAFKKVDEGNIKISSNKAISKLSLKLQADFQYTKNGQVSVVENGLNETIGKSYDLVIPESVTEPSGVSQSTIQSSAESESITQNNQSQSSNSNIDSSDKTTVEKNIETTTESETATNYPSNFALQASIDTILYNNITPQYTNDTKGVFPTNSWTPTGNTTVINHQGNKSATNQWDGITTWAGNPDNKTTSYIEYGGVKDKADFAIRKYAKETSTPGLYDMYLNVRGNQQKDIKPIDIVLVVDMSGSMKDNNRYLYIRQGVQNFFSTINNAGIGDYVNVGLVGYSSPGYIGGSNGDGTISSPFGKVSNTAHINEILGNNKLGQEFRGGTFTQLGIRKGTQMLAADTSGNQKLMILMTDGVPTFSYKVTAAETIDNAVYGTSFSTNTLDDPGNTSKLDNTYQVGPTSNRITIRDTWAATLGEGKISKTNGFMINALGIQLDKDANYLSKDEVRARMSLLASPGQYQDANSASDIQTYLEKQAQNVVSEFNTVVEGSISDPLGAQFYYNGSPDIKSVGTNPVTTLPTLTFTSGKLDVSHLNLGKDQEVQIHYQVRLNTETSDFVPEKWYQMNGRTTLVPNHNSPDNIVDFGIPSAKGEGISLTLNKIWEEYDGDKTNRPQNITYEIERSKTTVANAWQKGYVNIEGTKTQDTWTKNVTQLATQKDGNASLWLPKYNAQGETFAYKISNEIAVPGYDSSKINDTTFKNVKQFTPLILEVTKENGLGEKLSGAKFKLTDSQNQEIPMNVDSTGSIFTFSNLKVGKYILQEVEAPEGYAILKKNLGIDVLNNGTVKVDDQSIKVENHMIKLVVNNQQKGILPSTGGHGNILYTTVGAGLLVLFILAGGIYLIGRKKN